MSPFQAPQAEISGNLSMSEKIRLKKPPISFDIHRYKKVALTDRVSISGVKTRVRNIVANLIILILFSLCKQSTHNHIPPLSLTTNLLHTVTLCYTFLTQT